MRNDPSGRAPFRAPRLYLLIGPKGSGKSWIGRRLQARRGIPFLRVEALALAVTGVGDPFDRMLASLRRDVGVVLIRVAADPARCLERVRSRDRREHVAVSDAQVDAINAAVLARDHPFAGTLHNDDAPEDELLARFDALRAGADARIADDS